MVGHPVTYVIAFHAGSNSLDPEIVWAKLAALAEGAALASARYF
jgi:5-methyltetrahydropteroyltriglutamate--homocysteine methyltransferase